MKKLFTSLKFLLVAVCLLGGGNSAWADATSLYERGTTNAWTDADLTDWVSAYCTPTIASGLSVTTKGAGWTNTKSISVNENSIVTLNATLKAGGAPGRSGSYDYIQIGGVKVGFNEQDKIAFVDVDGASTNLALTYNRSSVYEISVEINTATLAVSYKVGGVSGSSSSSTAITNVVFGHNKAGSEGYEINPVLQKIEVLEEKQVVSTADYTINYKNGENVVKTVEASNVVGNVITALTAVDGEGEYVGNHYLITAAEAPSMVLVADAASNVLNVPVRAPYAATLSVTTTIGGTPNVVVTPLTETDEKVCNWSFAYSKYVAKDGIYYLCDETDFVQSGPFTDGETIEKTISYSTADKTIVAFYEAEGSAGSNTAYSNGGYSTVAAQNARDRGIATGTLAPGDYRFEGQLVADGNSGRAITLREGTADPMVSLVGSNSTKYATADFTVNSTTGALYINGANSGDVKTNLSTSFDYVLIRKTGVAVTFGTTNYATFASPYALDLTSTASLKAYKAAVSGSTVNFTELNQTVPANTGVLLEGTAGETVSIPVVASGDAVSENAFLVNATGTTFTAESGYTYFGLLKDKNPLTFATFDPATVAIPANKAYLKVLTTSLVHGLDVTFEGADGIETLKNVDSETMGNAMFDLSGRRVAKAQKGIYIVNGKKVVK